MPLDHLRIQTVDIMLLATPKSTCSSVATPAGLLLSRLASFRKPLTFDHRSSAVGARLELCILSTVTATLPVLAALAASPASLKMGVYL